MTKPPREKDDLYWTVLNAAVTMDIRHGHLKWKIADLARSSRVSRSLIYYYFGKSKEGILREAVSLFGDTAAGQTAENDELWKQGKFIEASQLSRTVFAKIPAIAPFYFLNRTADSEIGIALRAREQAFFKKIDVFFPRLSKSEKRGLFVIFFGLLFTPDMPEADPAAAIAMLQKTVFA